MASVTLAVLRQASLGLLALLMTVSLGSAQPMPARGGTLVVGVTADPGHLNPGITTAGGTHVVADHLYSGLLQFDEHLAPQPNLAEHWTVADEGRTYTFHLARGVTWHDGQPFTAADVKFTFEQVLLPFHARTKAGLESVLEAIETPDAHTVIFRFAQPYAPLLRRLDVVEAPILPKHRYQGTEILTNPTNAQPVGTGPFTFQAYQKGEQVVMLRNARYFKPGLPYLDRVVFKIIPHASTAALALEQGEVDYLWNLGGPEILRLQRHPDVILATTPAGPGGAFCLDTLLFNLRKSPFSSLEVRQAFAYGINREQLLAQVRFGRGRVATGPIASTLAWAYHPQVPPYPYDVAAAAALLDRAGYPPGPGGTRLRVVFVHASPFAKTAEVIREHLSRLGVAVDLQTMDVNAANERIFLRQDFDLAIGSYCNGPDPEIGVTRAYVSSNIKPIPFANGAAYHNPQIDELFHRAARTIDLAARTSLYAQIQEILVRDVPYWWLIETEGTRAYRKGIHGLRIWAGDFLEQAWSEPRR